MSTTVRVEGSLRAQADQAARRATAIVFGELSAAFQQSFTAQAWAWPRNLPTRKLKGSTVAEKLASYNRGEGITPPNPRNIIDDGNLRNSHSWRQTGPFQAVYNWSAEYATAVHDGAMIYPWGSLRAARNRGLRSRGASGPVSPPRRVFLPARPWTRAVMGQEDVGGVAVYDLGGRLRNVWLGYMRSGR